jgi:hypothetical protein
MRDVFKKIVHYSTPRAVKNTISKKRTTRNDDKVIVPKKKLASHHLLPGV